MEETRLSEHEFYLKAVKYAGTLRKRYKNLRKQEDRLIAKKCDCDRMTCSRCLELDEVQRKVRDLICEVGRRE